MPSLLSLEVENYRCLDKVEVALAPLSVLVGPNGSGKSALLDVIQFLGDSVREDLAPAVHARGGFRTLRFRGAGKGSVITIGIKAAVTRHAHANAPDEYTLTFDSVDDILFHRAESFTFKRTRGAGRRITIKGSHVTISDQGKRTSRRKLLQEQSLALSTLPRLALEEGGQQVRDIADLFASFRVFDVDVHAARQPSPMPEQ